MTNLYRIVAIITSTLIFIFALSPLSYANGPVAPNSYTAVTDPTTDLLAIKAAGETVIISGATTFTSGTGQTNILVSTGLDLNLPLANPENYTSGPGILLQTQSNPIVTNTANADFEEPLIAILLENDLSGDITDSTSIKFNFTAPEADNTMSVDFILLSQEFHTGDWDLAAIFINGVNYATFVDRPYLRINGSAGITNICTTGNYFGCSESPYTVNVITDVSSITQKLTVIAPIAAGLNTFMASVANTYDNFVPTALHLSGFQTFQQVGVGFGIQLVDEEAAPEEAAPEEAPRPDFIFINNPDDNTYRARINSDGKSLICSAGKYQYGLPGDIVDVTFNDVIYQLFVDGNLAGSITADASSASWDISEVTAKGLATCSISLGFNGARLSDSSDSNRNIFNAASLTKESQHLSARSLESRKLQDALNALIKARSEIRSAFESQRLALNASYENTIQELKSALESGKITSKQYAPGVRAANAEYREKLLPLSNSYQSSLTENTNGPTAANSESQSQLLEALKAIDASFAETLEKAGYGVVLN